MQECVPGNHMQVNLDEGFQYVPGNHMIASVKQLKQIDKNTHIMHIQIIFTLISKSTRECDLETIGKDRCSDDIAFPNLFVKQ